LAAPLSREYCQPKANANEVVIMNKARFDPQLYDLIPHRPPMLLINEIIAVDQRSSSAVVSIDSNASFFEALKGVPSWIGLEYMGQTAALIAGYQLKEGLIEPHLGFLLGTRAFKAEQAYFEPNINLLVSCSEKALVGDDLATFDCRISRYDSGANNGELLASANLSVFRRPKNERDKSER